MTKLARVAKLQRAVEVVFGNTVDMGDRMNSHPGVYRAYIARFERAVLLLETSYRLIRIYSS